MKHNSRHKARLIASSHLTDIPSSSIYSSLVSLRGICLVLLLAKINSLDSQSTDIDNAYLEAKTKKVCIIAEKEFSNLERYALLTRKILC